MENKKYLLAVDSYDMAGTEQKTTQAYCLEDGAITPLKDKEETGVFNLENYIGGGESLDYDLLQVDKDVKVIIIASKVVNNTAIVEVSYSKDEITGDEVRDAVEASYLKDCPFAKREVLLHDSLTYSDTLQELNEKTPENDFAKRHLEDIAFIESFFRGAEVA